MVKTSSATSKFETLLSDIQRRAAAGEQRLVGRATPWLARVRALTPARLRRAQPAPVEEQPIEKPVEKPLARLVTLTAENHLLLTGTTAGLALAGIVFAPAAALATPAMLLTALPNYAGAVEEWQRDRRLGAPALRAALVSAFVASHQVATGALGLLVLALAPDTPAQTTTTTTLATLGVSLLALPISNCFGVAATLYGLNGRPDAHAAVQRKLQQHQIDIQNWPAVAHLPHAQTFLIDDSCLYKLIVLEVRPFQHRLAEDVAWHALVAGTPAVAHQLRALYPAMQPGAVEVDVAVLTAAQLQDNRQLVVPCDPPDADALYVVVDGQVIGALLVRWESNPQARSLLDALRPLDAAPVLLSGLGAQQTRALLTEFGLQDGRANLTAQQKLSACLEYPGAYLIQHNAADELVVMQVAQQQDVVAVLDDESFGILHSTLEAYHPTTAQLLAIAPTLLTIGGVFFLNWRMPAAIAVQGGALLLRRVTERRARTADPAPDPAPRPALHAQIL